MTLRRQFPGFGGLPGAGSMIRYSIMRLEGNGRVGIEFGHNSILLFNLILCANINLHILLIPPISSVHEDMKCFHDTAWSKFVS